MLTLDVQRKEAYRSFLTAHSRLVCAIDGKLQAEGHLPIGWFDVLVTLEGAEGNKLRMSELADAVLLSRSGLTRLVDKLEAYGLVRREACPHDRRGFLCSLTEKGKQARERSWPLYGSLVQELFGSVMTDAEVEILRKAMDRVVKASEEILRKP